MNGFLITFFIIIFIFTVTTINIHATHISEPILSLEKNLKYTLNDTILISGWIKYNDEPATDVLLTVKLINPDGIESFSNEVRSNSNGNFSTMINLLNNNIYDTGEYTLIVESQCKDEHRNICQNFITQEFLEILN